MKFDAKWSAAAAAVSGAYGAKVRPLLWHVDREYRERPIFTAETDWPWPDGDYYVVRNSHGRVAKEFPNSWQAENFARYLNSKVSA